MIESRAERHYGLTMTTTAPELELPQTADDESIYDVTCGGCLRFMGFSKHPDICQTYCSTWCLEQPPIDVGEATGNLWMKLHLIRGLSAEDIARLWDTDEDHVVRVLEQSEYTT